MATPRQFERILKKQEDGTPVGLVYRPRRSKPDIFSKTEQLGPSSGPIFMLKQHVNQNVKVLIRRRRKIAYISRVIEYRGRLIMFDKHMNLALADVIESFVYKRGEQILKRARHRDNILLRGDNIILISV